jgi:hypothetical protein
MFLEMPNGFPRNRLFDCFSHSSHVVPMLQGIEKDMHVVRHDHISPQFQPHRLPSRIQGLHQPPSCTISPQQRQPMETTERQLVGVTSLIEVLAALANFAVRKQHIDSSATLPQSIC